MGAPSYEDPGLLIFEPEQDGKEVHDLRSRIRLLGLGLGLPRLSNSRRISRFPAKRYSTPPDPHHEAILRSVRSDPLMRAHAMMRSFRSAPSDTITRPSEDEVEHGDDQMM